MWARLYHCKIYEMFLELIRYSKLSKWYILHVTLYILCKYWKLQFMSDASSCSRDNQIVYTGILIHSFYSVQHLEDLPMSVTVRLVRTEEKIWPSGEFCPDYTKKKIIIIAILEKLSGMWSPNESHKGYFYTDCMIKYHTFVTDLTFHKAVFDAD